MRKPETGSQEGSSPSLQARSAKLEKIAKFIASASAKDNEGDLVSQRASMIRRDKRAFLESAVQAGVTDFKKFKVSPESVTWIKS